MEKQGYGLHAGSGSLLKSDLLDVMDMFMQQRRAVGFVADKIDDEQASASLAVVGLLMESTEVILQKMISKLAVGS